MLTLTGMLCRLSRCAAPRKESKEEETGGSNESSTDDLTVIRGIGITTQDRLYRAGIKSFSQLAKSSPEKIREILGSSVRGAELETWITDAAALAQGK